MNLCHIKSGFAILLGNNKIPYATSTVAFGCVGLVVFDVLNTVIVQEVIYVRVTRCVLATREQTYVCFASEWTEDHVTLDINPLAAIVLLENNLRVVDVVFALIVNHIEDVYAESTRVAIVCEWKCLGVESIYADDTVFLLVCARVFVSL